MKSKLLLMVANLMLREASLICVAVVKASRREMEWVLKRSQPCFQFKATSDFVVKMTGLPFDCSSKDLIRFLKG